MRIAILGTRGIPNNYGGFEQFAEYLALGLVKKGHDVTVYNSHTQVVSGSTAAAPGAQGTPSTADITPAKIDEIEVPS